MNISKIISTILLWWACSFHVYSQNATIEDLIHKIDSVPSSEKTFLLNELSKAYWDVSYQKSLETAQEALENAQSHNDTLGIAQSYNRIGNSFYYQYSFNKAISYYLKSLNLQEQLGSKTDIAKLHNNIALVYLKLDNFEKSYQHLVKAKEYEQDVPTETRANFFNSLGAVTQEMGKIDKALDNYLISLQLFQELGDDTKIGNTLHNIGNVYLEKKQYNKALNYYFKALTCDSIKKNLISIGETKLNIAYIYMLENKPDKAIKYIMQVREYAEKTQYLALWNRYYFSLSDYYKQKKNYVKAYHAQERYLETWDSLYNQQNEAAIAELEARHNIEVKEREIEMLKKDNLIQLLESQKHKSQRNGILILVLLVTITSILIGWAYKMKHKNNILLKEKNEALAKSNTQLQESEKTQKELNATKDKLFSIIAHDLINPFHSILGFSQYLAKQYDTLDDDDRIESAQSIYTASQQAYTLLNNLLQWARSQTNKLTYKPEKLYLYSIIQQNVLLFTSATQRKAINVNINIDQNTKIWADENLLSSVIRNLLSNAIKFSQPGGSISINSRLTEGNMQEVTISDKGLGIRPEHMDKLFMIDSNISQPGTMHEKGTGLGLVLCKEFIERNRGDIRVESTLGKGSSFIFTIPITKQ